MKITCQSCQSKYNVADEKVQGKIVKIRCKKCGATIVVNGTDGSSASAATNGAAAPESSAAAPSGVDAPATEGQWHVNVSETDQRTMSLAELVDAYNAGTVTQETFIWTDGMEDWRALAEVEAVVAALQGSVGAGASAPEPAPVPAPAAAPAPTPPVAFEPPLAAAPAASFGASAAAVTAAAPEPKRAAVKRETRNRDLFGTTDDVQTSAAASPAGLSASVDDGKLTGQRNESSVLFSLAVLTKSADQQVPTAQPAKNNRDDSGLIDLRALAAKAESMRPAASPAVDAFSAPLGAAPLPLGSPLGPVSPAIDETQPKSKLPLFIGLGLGGLVLVAVSVVVTVKLMGTGAPPVASVTPATPPATASAAEAASTTASVVATASAAPSASSASSVAAVSKNNTKAVGVGTHAVTGGTGTKTQAAATAAAATATTPPVVVKKQNDCGCNGDLMCLMKCSTH